MKLISLFSGIGGFELAGEWAGWQNVVSCEINPFGRKVLEYYWPNAYHHDDIKTLTFEKIDYELTQRFGAKWNADDIILTGGFPCQPYSAAGKRLGKEDERHLWPEMLRIIREVQPKWVVGENVLGLVNWSGGLVFEEVQADLESEGYEIQPYVLPAASVGNCPHKRDRVWFVAYRTTALTQNPDRDGRRGNEWQEKPCEWEQRNTCSRNNEWLQTDNGKAGPAPYTDHNGYATTKNGQGLGEGNDRNKTGQNYAIEFEGRAVSDGVAPDTNSLRHTSCGEGTEAQGIGCGNNGEQKERSEQTEWPNGLLGLQPNAPDTNHQGLQGGEKHRSIGGIRQNSNEQPTRFVQPNWENFPTQSPIRTGNDGLPTELDGITFSKWRNESIKAGGNAIVPQVVFQIFKAINEYQTNIQKP
jgi:DNA (cytosine-5)-methyltransferase 1